MSPNARIRQELHGGIWLTGSELQKLTRIGRGTIYVRLNAMAEAGEIEVDTSEARHKYRLTPPTP